MHDQNMKLAKIHDLELKMKMFDKIKLYDKKLSLLKKDMKNLHEWSLKLKVKYKNMPELFDERYCLQARAQKIEEVYRRNS